MQARDRLFVQREWIAYGCWLREGQTYPNALGFKSGVAAFSQEPGGGMGGSKVPTHFNGDKNVEIAHQVFWQLIVPVRVVVTGVFLYRMPEQQVADIIETTRHQIRKRLNTGYESLLQAISTEEHQRRVASG